MSAGKLAERLDRAIRRSGLTVEEVCAEARVNAEFIRNIRREGSLHPSFFKIIQLAATLKVSPFWLAGMTEDPEDREIPDMPPRRRRSGD